jgi:hypothetical protein
MSEPSLLRIGLLALVFALVLVFHMVRLLVIPDFETHQITVNEFVRRYNSKSRLFIAVDIGLFMYCIGQSILLSLEMAPIVFYELYDWWLGRIELDLVVAVRSIRYVKTVGIIKMLVLFAGLLTCIVKLLMKNFD